MLFDNSKTVGGDSFLAKSLAQATHDLYLARIEGVHLDGLNGKSVRNALFNSDAAPATVNRFETT